MLRSIPIRPFNGWPQPIMTSVFYYGQEKERRDVLREYADLVKRWPVRRYWAQQMTVNCYTADKCVIDAVMSWDNSSQARNARSTGTSTLHLFVRKWDGRFLIDAVNGEVKSEQACVEVNPTAASAVLVWGSVFK